MPEVGATSLEKILKRINIGICVFVFFALETLENIV